MNDSYPVRIEKLNTDCRQVADDWVAVEEPLEIRLGFLRKGHRRIQPIAVTMRTPGNEFDLAVGFLLTESIVSDVAQIEGVKFCGEADDQNQNVVRVDLDDSVDVDLERLKRNFYVTSSCGVCGKSSIDALEQVGFRKIETGITLEFDHIRQLPAELRSHQRAFDQTGGLHAAAIFDHSGSIVAASEDVGRHNAVDKVIGQIAQSDVSPNLQKCGLMLSGRISFELVQKAVSQGISAVCAVGAPSSLAVHTADTYGVTLVGFLGEERANIYTHPARIR